jgi:hypothetical protein
MANPRTEYEQRLASRRAESDELRRRNSRLSTVRLVVALAGVFTFWFVFVHHGASPVWMLAPVAAFLLLVILHERTLQALRRADRSVRFYEQGLARVKGEWQGQGESGERFRDVHHPYAESLDLFGTGSLFQLLCRARTSPGEETLARWLLEPAPKDQIAERQQRVERLRDRLDLREALMLVGEDIRAGVHPDKLAQWGEAESKPVLARFRLVSFLLPALTVAGAILWAWQGSRILFVASGALQAMLAYRLRPRVNEVLDALDQPAHELALMAELLKRLHEEPGSDHLPPAAPLARLARLVELLDNRRNAFFAPVAAMLLWGVHFAAAIEDWRTEHGRMIRGWLARLGEFEALNSFAAYAWEHPADPFPVILDGPARLSGESMAHPLLPPDRAVANSLEVSAGQPLVIISGSNMSGKSTMLRTVGVNAVLALAGAPVRAARLELTPLSLGASIRIVDSLQEGSSRFFAEIRQLRLLIEQTQGPRPLLFLLDELLSGTNSHDRRIGAAGVLQGLLARGAIGVVTTHDLALTQIPALNVHFEDHLEAGRMTFDYQMRPGVVAKSNALELMRSIGLDV